MKTYEYSEEGIHYQMKLSTPQEMIKEFPTTVYKYRTWGEKFDMEILKDEQLFFSSARLFKDEYDCHPLWENPSIQECIDYSINTNPWMDEQRHKQFAMKKWQECANIPKEILERKLKEINDKRYEQFGVLCLTHSKFNSYLWKQYSYEHNGFCVEFNGKKLAEHLLFDGMGEVHYHGEPAKTNCLTGTLKGLQKTFYHKTYKYQKEDEFRVIRTCGHILSNEERNEKFSTDCISVVYIDSEMRDDYKDEIHRVSKGIYPIKEMKVELVTNSDEAIVSLIRRDL